MISIRAKSPTDHDRPTKAMPAFKISILANRKQKAASGSVIAKACNLAPSFKMRLPRLSEPLLRFGRECQIGENTSCRVRNCSSLYVLKMIAVIRTSAIRSTPLLNGFARNSVIIQPTNPDKSPIVTLAKVSESPFWEHLKSASQARLGVRSSEHCSVRLTNSGLVGAAGFEPTTCSTQNCRATRLRYTPMARCTVDNPIIGVVTRLKSRQQGDKHAGSAPVEQGMGDPVARRDAVFLGGAGRHLQHARASPPEEMIFVDSGSVFSAIRRMRPSARMKIMSSEI